VRSVAGVTVRVGFLGAGLIATHHSRSLRASGADATWAGVFDPDRERAERFAAASGAAPCDSEDEVVAGCDAVYVCTWTSEHPRLVAKVAEAGRAVFCEKPLATDLPAVDSMLAAVEAAGVINQVGLVLRHSPAFGLLKAIAADPASGRPMNVVFRDDQYIPVQGLYASTWRGDVRRAGGGTLLEHSIHDLDLLEWVVGRVTSVAARTATFHELDGIEDSVTVLLTFAGGAIGSLTSVWHDVLERESNRRFELLSERSHVALEGDWWGPVDWQPLGQPAVRLEGEALQDEAARRGAALGNPDGQFIAAVAGNKPAWPSFADAHRAHELADAVYRSAAAGGAPIDC
jgi:predicted dehydrogenase